MSENEKPTVAVVLSLMGGIFILLGGGMMSMIGFPGHGGMMNGYGGYGYGYGGYGMMGGFWSNPGFGMMSGYGLGYGMGWLGFAGILFGIAVVASALMLYSHPTDHSKWGILILIFSVLSILGSAMAGFGVGLILGVLGGIFALTWKPPTPVTK
jgi:hypothetical protein